MVTERDATTRLRWPGARGKLRTVVRPYTRFEAQRHSYTNLHTNLL